ncbi:ABC transporter permease [Nesterenkonia muleiensis]|uniref:ABC transporter permease n=1 Tax=Nesterenkonia muleiensis TaxID=2282648 RepID=UPI000E73B719|nr:ABC transporter permease [Nesterenkonia muleiensis]
MKTLIRAGWTLWLPVLLVTIWWFASANSTNIYVPSLSRIVEVLWRDISSGLLIDAARVSLTNLAVGLLIAAAVGILLGLLIGETRRLRLILDPYIHFFRSVPQSALVPLIIGAMGIGAAPKIYTVAFACVWPILLNTIDGVRGVEPTIRSVSRVFGVPKLLYFRRVVLPGAMPQVVAGLRVALPIGIVVMVVSELFASNQGLGFYILNSSATFQIPETWGGALMVGVIGYIIVIMFSLFERRVLSWYFRSGAL